MPLFVLSTLWRPVALATAGFSALYAVAVVFFYCDWLFDVPGADPLVYGDQFAFTQMTVVAFALLYLIVSGVALLRNREQRAYDRALRRKDEIIRRYQEARRDVLGLACEELAASRGLTKREAELLRIFAQGRDAAYAERTLFLSRNTVKSYAKSLYVKLGVHSKQEVIDLVNASLPTDF